MSTDYGPAIWLGNSQIGYGGWQPTNRHWIIVHGTAGDATIEAVQATFMYNYNHGDPSSTHYAIGEDGRIGQYVPEASVAWGNGPITGPAGVAIQGAGNAHDAWWDTAYPGNANPDTMSIEHCKSDKNNSSALTTAQQAASFALIKHLCERWGIPKKVYGVASYNELTQGGITGHFSMDPVNRAFCPGTYPWHALQAYLDGTQAGIILDHDATGEIVGAHDAGNPALHVRAGMAKDLNRRGWLAATISVSETMPLAEGETVAVVRGAQKAALTYTPAEGVVAYGGTIAAAVQDLYNLLAQTGKAP